MTVSWNERCAYAYECETMGDPSCESGIALWYYERAEANEKGDDHV